MLSSDLIDVVVLVRLLYDHKISQQRFTLTKLTIYLVLPFSSGH